LSISRIQFHHSSTRQLGKNSTDLRMERLDEDGGEPLVLVCRGQGGKARNRFYFLEEDEVRLTVSDEGMEAPHVCPFIGIEADDREERGHSLYVLPRERYNLLSSVKAGFPPWKRKKKNLFPP
jgi:hypothetical protein